MTSIFQAMSGQPDMVNEYANRMLSKQPEMKFSDVFSHFFGSISSSMLSWIDIFSRHFAIENVKNVAFRIWFKSAEGNFVLQTVDEMFKQLISREEQEHTNQNEYNDRGIKHLYICLFYTYQLLMKQGYSRKDAPFNFMNGFPVEATRVVILGHEPADVYSSGYAFHKSECDSTLKFIDVIFSDMQILSACLGDSFQMTEAELKELQDHCNLQGLINQGVLFMNVKLTPDNQDFFLNRAWEMFTDFLLAYLSKQKTPIVFILAGNVAWKKERLIDQNIHFCMKVHHPSFYSPNFENNTPSPRLDWDRNVPLINANFFIFQFIGPEKMIDWSDVSGTKSGKEDRLASFAEAFGDIVGSPKNHILSDYFRTLKGKKGDSYYFYLVNDSHTVIMPPPCG